MQKVIRTYPHNFTNPTKRLNEALEEGYEVVMCNPFYIAQGKEGLEYIVEKKDKSE